MSYAALLLFRGKTIVREHYFYSKNHIQVVDDFLDILIQWEKVMQFWFDVHHFPNVAKTIPPISKNSGKTRQCHICTFYFTYNAEEDVWEREKLSIDPWVVVTSKNMHRDHDHASISTAAALVSIQ